MNVNRVGEQAISSYSTHESMSPTAFVVGFSWGDILIKEERPPVSREEPPDGPSADECHPSLQT